jgi:hypothetical protein
MVIKAPWFAMRADPPSKAGLANTNATGHATKFEYLRAAPNA